MTELHRLFFSRSYRRAVANRRARDSWRPGYVDRALDDALRALEVAHVVAVDDRLAAAALDDLHDLLGREVALLVDERKEPGTHVVAFNASGHSSGIYVYRLRAGSFVQARMMVVLR